MLFFLLLLCSLATVTYQPLQAATVAVESAKPSDAALNAIDNAIATLSVLMDLSMQHDITLPLNQAILEFQKTYNEAEIDKLEEEVESAIQKAATALKKEATRANKEREIKNAIQEKKRAMRAAVIDVAQKLNPKNIVSNDIQNLERMRENASEPGERAIFDETIIKAKKMLAKKSQGSNNTWISSKNILWGAGGAAIGASTLIGLILWVYKDTPTDEIENPVIKFLVSSFRKLTSKKDSSPAK